MSRARSRKKTTPHRVFLHKYSTKDAKAAALADIAEECKCGVGMFIHNYINEEHELIRAIALINENSEVEYEFN